MILLPNSFILSGLDFNFDFEQTLGCSRPLAGNPHARTRLIGRESDLFDYPGPFF
jgi:hypothetical protein